jgi:hypothetical protein
LGKRGGELPEHDGMKKQKLKERENASIFEGNYQNIKG